MESKSFTRYVFSQFFIHFRKFFVRSTLLSRDCFTISHFEIGRACSLSMRLSLLTYPTLLSNVNFRNVICAKNFVDSINLKQLIEIES